MLPPRSPLAKRIMYLQVIDGLLIENVRSDRDQTR